MSSEVTRQQRIEDARSLLTWIESHPDVPLPQELEWSGLTIVTLDTKDEAVALIKALGSCEKVWNDDMFSIMKTFGALKLKAIFWRQQICERVVVGSEEVPEKVIPASVRELVEWRCEPLLQATNEAVG